MQVTHKSRIQIRLQNIAFVVLFLIVIGLLAWLGKQYNYESDWTASGRHTLSEATVKILERMDGPIDILVFITNKNYSAVQRDLADMLKLYQTHKDDIHVEYIDSITEPDQARKYNISEYVELVVTYDNRTEHVKSLSEENLTNTLQQIMRTGDRHIVFLSGHGERDPNGKANHDYGNFVGYLNNKGIRTSTLKLGENPVIPENTAALVIAGPQLNYLPGEVELIRDYLKQGGNLLWLHDPGKLHGLQPLLQDLGLEFVKGTVVDPSTRLYGINDPTFAVIASYSQSNHPITRNFRFMTIFPRAAAIKLAPHNNYETMAFLQTVPRSWSETSKLDGVINFDQGSDTAGPLNIGVALQREIDAKQGNQRIVVLGDGDFLANAYLGNQGNRDMGYNIINWLSNDDNFIDIPARVAPDTELTLDSTTWSILGLLFLFGLPLVLLGYGLFIWWQRRKQ